MIEATIPQATYLCKECRSFLNVFKMTLIMLLMEPLQGQDNIPLISSKCIFHSKLSNVFKLLANWVSFIWKDMTKKYEEQRKNCAQFHLDPHMIHLYRLFVIIFLSLPLLATTKFNTPHASDHIAVLPYRPLIYHKTRKQNVMIRHEHRTPLRLTEFFICFRKNYIQFACKRLILLREVCELESKSCTCIIQKWHYGHVFIREY